MILARVCGTVVTTISHPFFDGHKQLIIRAIKPDGMMIEVKTTCRIDTPVEVDYYRNGGILHMVLRRMAAE